MDQTDAAGGQGPDMRVVDEHGVAVRDAIALFFSRLLRETENSDLDEQREYYLPQFDRLGDARFLLIF